MLGPVVAGVELDARTDHVRPVQSGGESRARTGSLDTSPERLRAPFALAMAVPGFDIKMRRPSRFKALDSRHRCSANF